MAIDDGGQAFPCPGDMSHQRSLGASLRAFLAAHAPEAVFQPLDGMTTNEKSRVSGVPMREYASMMDDSKVLAFLAVRYADAVIAELGKEKP